MISIRSLYRKDEIRTKIREFCGLLRAKVGKTTKRCGGEGR